MVYMSQRKDFEKRAIDCQIAPDWHTNFKKEWTQDEITQNIIAEVGHDIIRPCKYFVYGKLYMMDTGEGKEKTYENTSNEVVKDVLNQTVCKILAFGDMAFKDISRFPYGPTAYIGQWYKIDLYEHRKFQVAGNYCILFPDMAIDAHISDPYYIDQLVLASPLM